MLLQRRMSAIMSQRNNDSYNQRHVLPNGESEEDLERLLSEGVTFDEDTEALVQHYTSSPLSTIDEEDDIEDAPIGGDLQGALAVFAEAAQDMATAGVELGLGRHFACADFCNQAAEKAVQSVAMLRFGRRMAYNHDLRALGTSVNAPPDIRDALETLTPFHPETFYAETPPEEADEVISAEQASTYIQTARTILRWARTIVLSA